ncbi:SDR family NAD(P)-dependent oxidoreductase [Spirulina sp. 06S082]|uniref:SDR family NAD(P)-dependent oxidoreductase n=1 Tax=Spirulina sp. 06S082 TaxID=3110248 RepID=UPI002B1ED837|nr:SDR family NAD(P)-dependent oxidoreductase [Spirulina sp. 06S082]MEA5472069.1 SDR family NAD(P)-dependent oxidoreductase [Spirulina sp. 06S082]
MNKNLKGQIALVTGASRGVGKGIAIGLGESGATVYITGRTIKPINNNTDGSLQETQTAVEKAGGTCIPIQVDHSDDKQIRQLFERIDEEQEGKLDILVNNAYAGGQTLLDSFSKSFWESDPTLWDVANNVGLRSHYITSVYAARMMIKRKTGFICNISSWAGVSYVFSVPYGVGKSSCDRLASDMAQELKQYNVTSISVYPGIVGTEMTTNFDWKEYPDSFKTAFGHGYYNWETPLFTGRAIAALASDPNLIKQTGRVRIVAEVAQKYGFFDKDGNRPVSFRSLRFSLPMANSFLRKYPWLVPDIKIPWFIILLTMLSSPKI